MAEIIPEQPVAKSETAFHIFLGAVAGAAGTAIVGLIFSSATFEWMNRFVQLPAFPTGAILFVQDRECTGLGKGWVPFDAAEGKYVRVASSKDESPPGVPHEGGSLKFKLSADNLPALKSILKFKSGTIVNQDGPRHFVVTIGGNSGAPDSNQVGSPAFEGVPQEFPIELNGVGANKEIDVTPPYMTLTACRKK